MSILWVGLAMLAQDTFMTWKSLAANRGRPLLAGLCDMLGGFMVVATIGISVNTAAKHGLSWYTAAVFASMGAADFGGAFLGTVTGNRWIHVDSLAPVKKLISATKPKVAT